MRRIYKFQKNSMIFIAVLLICIAVFINCVLEGTADTLMYVKMIINNNTEVFKTDLAFWFITKINNYLGAVPDNQTKLLLTHCFNCFN